MATFKTATMVEDIVWSLRLGDYPRSLNRARINDLFNGQPPYSDKTAKDLHLAVNVNFMEATRMAHDARRQFTNAMLKPGRFFSVMSVDRGPKHKRKDYAFGITSAINRKMKRSLHYFEDKRSTMANVVLHGTGPNVWPDRQCWCPDPVGVEDVLLPSGTLLTMKNVPFFAVFRNYTSLQLWKLTHGPKVDKGWNMPMVERAIKWADGEKIKAGLPNSDIYSPEKMAERFKEDSGLYSSDAVPTIDCWDFYFWNDEDKQSGWNRRIVLDADWNYGGVGGTSLDDSARKALPSTTKMGHRGEFLFDSGKRKYADKIGEIIHFQFGDLSAVAPFRYHSVRSLGFLLFGICHLQNRLRCSFNSALFEQMLQYFRVRSLDDFERTLKINLVNYGFLDETVQFVPAAERWQLNAALVEMGLNHNKEIIMRDSASFVQDSDTRENAPPETATKTMAQIQSLTSLVSAALMQAYEYDKFQYYEIARRFCMKNSRDRDVRDFRAEMLKSGIPEEVLDTDCWEIEAEKVMGGGNKMLETAIADRLMMARQLFDPESQREILRDFTLAVTDDVARADRLVPQDPLKVTDTVHDAQLASGALMMGMRVDFRGGSNPLEAIPALLGEMTMVVQKIDQSGGVATPQQLDGLQNLANYINQHIQFLAQDQSQKAVVKEFGDDLGKLVNFVKAFAQRLEEQQKAAAQQNGNGQLDPKDMAKVEGMRLQAQVKAANTQESHAQRTSQRQVQFEMTQQQQAEKHALEMKERIQQAAVDTEVKDLEAAADISREDAKPQKSTSE